MIWMPSCSRSPDAPVRLARSEPARSTKCSFGRKVFPSAHFMSSASVKMACDRDDDAFIAVAPVARLRAPSQRTAIASATVATTRVVLPVSEIPPLGSSRIGRVASVPASAFHASRSCTSSL